MTEETDDEFEEALMDAFDGELPSDPPTPERLDAFKEAIKLAPQLEEPSARRADFLDFAGLVAEAFPGQRWDAHKIQAFRQAIRSVSETKPASVTDILLARRRPR